LVFVETIEQRSGLALVNSSSVVHGYGGTGGFCLFSLEPRLELFKGERAVAVLVCFFETVRGSFFSNVGGRQGLSLEAFGVRHRLEHGQKVIGKLLEREKERERERERENPASSKR